MSDRQPLKEAFDIIEGLPKRRWKPKEALLDEHHSRVDALVHRLWIYEQALDAFLGAWDSETVDLDVIDERLKALRQARGKRGDSAES